jgi:hypothetical protein
LEIRTHLGKKGFLVWLSAYPCGERPYIDDLSRQPFVLNDVGNGLAIIGAMLVSLTTPLAGFLYYREYLLGREFMHDLLLDPFRDWSVVAPFFAGAFLALLPIELGLFCAALNQRDLQRPLEWMALVLSTVLLLKSDLSRLAIYAILRERTILRIVRFLLLVLIGSLVSILPFLVLSSAVRVEVYCQLLVCLARTSVDGNRLHGSRSLSRLSYGSRTSLEAKKVALVLIQGANQLLIFATILNHGTEDWTGVPGTCRLERIIEIGAHRYPLLYGASGVQPRSSP